MHWTIEDQRESTPGELSPTETHGEIFHKSTMNSSRIFDLVGGVIRDVVPLMLDTLSYK
jgi:hypothetical protein